MKAHLLRRLGVFDLAMITVGAIVGSGIFRTPAAVAARAQSPALVLGCWIAGGAIALTGAFVFAELAARRPLSGGLYAYLREAYHPLVAFVFGWTLLLISDTGGTAASAVLFAGYLQPLTGLHLDERVTAALVLAILAVINLLGVRQGTNWQNLLVALKIAALAALIAAGLLAHPEPGALAAAPSFGVTGGLLGAIGFAMIPVLFAYNGFQSASYISGETRQPERTIPRGLLIGVGVVVAVYVLVNLGCLRVLGIGALATTQAPAAAVMRAAIGPFGARIVALAVAISTLGFMSTRILCTPRIYHQMAADGVFFQAVAWVDPRTHAPSVAIGLQAGIAALIALSGTYEQIVNWVTAPEWLFVLLAAVAIFIFRRRDAGRPAPPARIPGHPFTTSALIAVLFGIFVSEAVVSPRDTLYGAAVLLSGVAVYAVASRTLAKRR